MRRICSWHECRSPFDAVRDDKRFCSDNCRAKANKAKQKAAEVVAVDPPVVAAPARVERSAPAAVEPPPPATKKWSREDFSFSADQGDYNPVERDAIPATPVGRIARLEDRLHDIEQDFDLAEPERRNWERLRPKIEALLAANKAAPPPPPPVASAPPGLTAGEVTNMVRAEVNNILKTWRERILLHDTRISELRGDLEELAEKVKASKKVHAVEAPPAPSAAGTDKRAVAKIAEMETAIDGVRERLDAVESDVAEAWKTILRQASGDDDDGDEDEEYDEDEDDDAA